MHALEAAYTFVYRGPHHAYIPSTVKRQYLNCTVSHVVPRQGFHVSPGFHFSPSVLQPLPRGVAAGPFSSSLQPCCTGSAEPSPYTGHIPAWPQEGAWCLGLGLTPFPAPEWDSPWLPVRILAHKGVPTAPGPTIEIPKSFCTLTQVYRQSHHPGQIHHHSSQKNLASAIPGVVLRVSNFLCSVLMGMAS